uniref:Uncharacterized protein n=2 Tax=Knipowitschia caucasica TaxID=637954 RepID=A0AAV2LF49_KNICA
MLDTQPAIYQTEVQVSPCKHIQARKHHFPPPPPPSRTRAIPQTVLTKLGTQGERPTTPSISTQHSNMDLYERPDQGMSASRWKRSISQRPPPAPYPRPPPFKDVIDLEADAHRCPDQCMVQKLLQRGCHRGMLGFGGLEEALADLVLCDQFSPELALVREFIKSCAELVLLMLGEVGRSPLGATSLGSTVTGGWPGL